MNPNEPQHVTVSFDDWGDWTFLVGWNGLALAVQAQVGGPSFGSSPFTLDDDEFGILGGRGRLDPVPVGWSDLTCDIVSLDLQRGASEDNNILSRYEAGTCSLTLNNLDGKYNPDGAFGKTIDLSTTIRVMGRNADIVPFFLANTDVNPSDYLYRWFTGRIDVWDVVGFTDTPQAKIEAVDDTAVLAAYNGLEQLAGGAGDTTQARINRILTNAAWHTQDSEAEGGAQTTVAWFGSSTGATHAATTLAQPAWQEILLTADSALYAVFFNGDNRITAAPLNPNEYDDWTQQAWGCGNDDDVPIADATINYSKDQLHNIADGARAGGSQVTVINESSVTQYGSFRYGRSDLNLDNDTDVADWAGFVVASGSELSWRVDSFRVLPFTWPPYSESAGLMVNSDSYVAGVYDSTTSVAAWDVICSEITWLNGFGRRHTVTVDLPFGQGSVMDTVAIRGCKISLDVDMVDLTFITSSIRPFLDVFTLDDEILGVLDAANVLV